MAEGNADRELTIEPLLKLAIYSESESELALCLTLLLACVIDFGL